MGAVAVKLQQPLLKNLWVDAPRLNIQVSRKQLKISELALRGQLMNVVARVELAYYDLLLVREGRCRACSSLISARQLRNSRVLSRRISARGATRGSMGSTSGEGGID